MSTAFDILLNRYLSGSLSAAERRELLDRIASGEYRDEIDHALDHVLQAGEYDIVENTVLGNQIYVRLQPLLSEQRKPGAVHRVHFLRTASFRVAVAVLLIVIAGTVYYFANRSAATKEIVQQKDNINIPHILPGSNKAILILSDGKQIELNNTTSEIINDGNVAINNDNGELRYKNSGIAAVNTMRTPKGGQYHLTLSDGTKAWLNAASSITYPTAFTGNRREVMVTGEVYFEVAKNSKQPFIVSTGKDNIAVLGTAFNVNAYQNEPAVKTSLLNGRVKIAEKILYPGQAFIDGKIINTNISQDVAWKNGEFNFDNLEFSKAMRQLERWYDVEVVYDGAVPTGKFSGTMDRGLTLQQVLEGLSGVIATFKLEGRTLHILP